MQACIKLFALFLIGTLMKIWKSPKIFVFIWKWYVEGFTLKHLLPFQVCAHELNETFVYKHTDVAADLDLPMSISYVSA